MSALLEVRDLRTCFKVDGGEFTAVDGVSFSVAAGRTLGIVGESGSGKTTLVKRLLEACPHLEFSISACTRKPRNGEVHSKDYYFFEEEEFKRLIAEDAFVEWEMVYAGKYYGTLKSELQRIWDAGKSPLVDIDVQGSKIATP